MFREIERARWELKYIITLEIDYSLGDGKTILTPTNQAKESCKWALAKYIVTGGTIFR